MHRPTEFSTVFINETLDASLWEALQDKTVRWIQLDAMTAELTGQLQELLNARLHTSFRWMPLDAIYQSFDRVQLEHSSCTWLVIDALGHNESLLLQRALKYVLHAFPNKRILVVGDGNLAELTLPSYFGKSVTLAVPFRSSTRDDLLLLQHSRLIVPKYTQTDLVLAPKVKMKFNEAISYIVTKQACEDDWGFRERHSRGHGVTLLFHGASGTGKTMAAEVVAHTVGMPLYQIDLSSIVSKWVGETEKTLKNIFRSAQGIKGILLFDEGDALFGQRTQVEASQDRYSNMEVNFLLQEIESFDGIVILSTNHETALDPAFLRRFTYCLTFSLPERFQRLQIWKNNIPKPLPLGQNVDFDRLSLVPLSGGKIKNCIRHAAARAKAQLKAHVDHEDFLWAIKREQQKHGEILERAQVGEDFWRRVAPEWEHLQGNAETTLGGR